MANTYRIKADIKNGTIAHAYLIYGTEGYLKRLYRDQLVDALLSDKSEMNYAHFINHTGKVEETQSVIGEITSLAMTPPFFSERRVIVTENMGFGKKGYDEINEVLNHLPETTYMIFLEEETRSNTKTFKLIKDKYALEECNYPDMESLIKWAGSIVVKAGLEVSRATISNFIEVTGESMDNMDNELQKLISYCMSKGKVEYEDIYKVCVISIEEDIFKIINAIADGRKSVAMAEYAKLYKVATEPRKILSSLTSSFTRYLNILQAKNAGKPDSYIMSALGFKNDWAIKNGLRNANTFGEEKLKYFINLGAETVYKLNTGLLDERTGVEMFILKCLEN